LPEDLILKSKTGFHLPVFYFANHALAYSDDASFLFWMPEKYDVENLLLV